MKANEKVFNGFSYTLSKLDKPTGVSYYRCIHKGACPGSGKVSRDLTFSIIKEHTHPEISLHKEEVAGMLF